MKTLKIAALLVIASTTACHATRYNVTPTDSKNYQLDVVMETSVGSPMVSTEDQELKRGRWIGIIHSSSGYEETITKFKKELIYGGKSGDTVNVSYREYGDDYARPAFAQELKYDLKSSKEIRFQNFRLLVLSADNSSIKFKVLSDLFMKLHMNLVARLSGILCAVILFASSAMADKLCLQTTVNRKTFKVTSKSVTAATCPKGFTELVDTSSFQGPAGFDTATCYSKATSEDSVFGVAVTDLSCTDTTNDFMLAEGLEKTRLTPVISEKKLILDSTSKIPVGVEYTTGYLSGSTTYTQTVTIVCCKRSR